jgi:hypothetical protein
VQAHTTLNPPLLQPLRPFHMLFANLLERTCPLFFLTTSSSRVLPAFVNHSFEQQGGGSPSFSFHYMPKENGWTHVDPRYRIRRCRLYSRQSRRRQRLSCFASPVLSFSPRAVTKENPHQPTPLHTVVDNSTTVATIGRRGGTEYPYGTSELSRSLINGSRNDLLVLTLLFRN